MQTETLTRSATLSARALRDIATLAVIASKDKARPILTGIYLKTTGGEIIATATDSYQLGQMTYECTGDELEVIVPAAYLERIAKEFSKRYDGDVTLHIDGVRIETEIQGNRYTDLLIDGTYPNADNLIETCRAKMRQERTTGANEANVTLNIPMLAKIAKVAPFTEKGATGDIFTSTHSEAIMITGGQTLIMQMPVRVNR